MKDFLVQVSFHNGSGAEFSCSEEAAKELAQEYQAWLGEMYTTKGENPSMAYANHILAGKTHAGGVTSSTLLFSTIAQLSIIELIDAPLVAPARPVVRS